MNVRPPELQKYGAFLDAQPTLVHITFQYCLCLIMVEAGKMHLVETLPGHDGTVCTFETATGDIFSIAHPQISRDQEAALIKILKSKLNLV